MTWWMWAYIGSIVAVLTVYAVIMVRLECETRRLDREWKRIIGDRHD